MVTITEEKVDTVAEFKEIIISGGDRVERSTKTCFTWLSEHQGSCDNCPSDLGCKKLVQLMRLRLPTDLPDQQIDAHMDDILNARTDREVREAFCLPKVHCLD